jgi:hypothetical protein
MPWMSSTSTGAPGSQLCARRSALRGAYRPCGQIQPALDERSDHAVDLLSVHRRAEIVALGQPAALGIEHRQLLGALDAFGDRIEAEAATETERGPHDRRRARIVLERGDERAVELDLVEGEAAQIAEAGVPDAEIVDLDLDAELPSGRAGWRD